MENIKQEDEYTLYMIFNESLNMSTGKIAAQSGHAIQLYLSKIDWLKNNFHFLPDNINKDKVDLIIENDRVWKSNTSDSRIKKIALKADQKEFNKLKEFYKQEYTLDPIVVIDAGLTEILPGSETVFVFHPIKKEDRPKLLKRLRTL